MSVETVATETETVAAVVDREPVTVSALRNMHSNPALRIADEFNPQDESLDKWYVNYTYREDATGYGDGSWENGRVRLYEIRERNNGQLDVGNVEDNFIDARRVMEIFPGDYTAYFQHAKVLNSVGKFGAVYYDYLPREMRNLSHWPHCSNALFEILAVDGSAKTARVRLFAFSDDNSSAEYNELGEHTVPLDKVLNAEIYTPEQFKTRYGLAKLEMPEGTLFEQIQTGEMWTVTGHSYSNVKIKRTDNDGKVSGRHSNASLSDLSPENNHYIRLGDSWNDYLLSQPTGEAAEMLKELSKITVSKALKHADANNYCSETAVALASAGHSLPELRVKGTITLNVDVSTKEYMVLRKLMGATEGNADEAVAKMFGDPENNIPANMSLYKRLAGHSNGALPEIGQFGNGATFDLTSELVWKAPRIRK